VASDSGHPRDIVPGAQKDRESRVPAPNQRASWRSAVDPSTSDWQLHFDVSRYSLSGGR